MGFRYWVLLICLSGSALFAEKIDTFYGPIEVEEPVLLELIHSPAFQRLKSIHQYGISYYTTHREEYNRYDHSIGVFTILRVKGASLVEQIAGLLHDVSHTIFSHVGDWIFGKEQQEIDYQSTIHGLYLAVSGLETILNKYGFTVERVLPSRKNFIMLEQRLPNLSADRIDYNIQGAYFQNFLTKKEALEVFRDIYFEGGRWILTRQDLAAKLMQFSLFMTEDCWGSAVNHLTSVWFADAIKQAQAIGLISWHQLHFGIDQDVWDKLQSSFDPFIQDRMHKIFYPHQYFHYVDPANANLVVKYKCRAIDPWIKSNGNPVRLTSLDLKLADSLRISKEKAAMGWQLEVCSPQETLTASQ